MSQCLPLGSLCAHISQILEAAPIGWQLFVLESGKSDSIVFLLLLATYATRLLAQALGRCLFVFFFEDCHGGGLEDQDLTPLWEVYDLHVPGYGYLVPD